MCACMFIYLKQEAILHTFFFLNRRWENKLDITPSRCQSQGLTRCREVFRHVAGEGIIRTKNKSFHLRGASAICSSQRHDGMAEQKKSPCINSSSTELSRTLQTGYAQKHIRILAPSPLATPAISTIPDVHNGRGGRTVSTLCLKYLTVIQGENSISAQQKERSWGVIENTQIRCLNKVNSSIPCSLCP